MSVDACAELVRRGDPDRHAATLAAPPEARARLWPLYAFNLEIARAPYVTQEPLIAEMRLQFWADTVAEAATGATPRAHEVATPLAALIRDHALPPAAFEGMIAARRRDITRAPFDDTAALLAHVDATAGALMELAARSLGAGEGTLPVVSEFARGAGLANWLMAVPALEAAGQPPLPSGVGADVLAQTGLVHLRSARAHRAKVPRAALSALLTGWQAKAVLTRAVRDPAAVAEGRLAPSEFRRRGGLLLRSVLGRW